MAGNPNNLRDKKPTAPPATKATMTHPPPKIINIFDSVNEAKDISSVELATQFDLDRISIRYVLLPQEQKTIEVPIVPKANLLCYIIRGEGNLSMNDETAKVEQDDAFSFAASEFDHSLSFTLTALSDNLAVLVVSDIAPREHFITVCSFVHQCAFH